MIIGFIMKIPIIITIIFLLTAILPSSANSNGECNQKNQRLLNPVLDESEEEVKHLLQ